MNITRTVRFENGVKVYDPPMTPAEIEADKRRFEDLCRSRCAPGTMGTDRAFLEGHHEHGFTDEPEFMRNMLLYKAKKAGVVTTGKKYVGGLADHRGPADPRAWVSDTHEVKKVCEERNLDCRGLVQHKAREVERPADVPLHDMHIKSLDKMYGEKDPNWLKKSKQERREAIIDTHGAPARGRGKRKVL